MALDLDVATLSAAEIGLIGLKALTVAFCLMALIPRYPPAAVRQALAARERHS